MLQFIVDGGPPSILILVFGPILVVFAAISAWRPAEHRLRFARGLSHAIAWIMIGGFASGMRVTLRACAQLPADIEAQKISLLMMGTAESLAVVILGTAFLTLGWFLIAAGMRRAAS